MGRTKNYDKGLKAFDTKDYAKAFKLLKPFADEGDSMAEFVIGFCYFNPELSFKNDSLAEYYLINSAEKITQGQWDFLQFIFFKREWKMRN